MSLYIVHVLNRVKHECALNMFTIIHTVHVLNRVKHECALNMFTIIQYMYFSEKKELFGLVVLPCYIFMGLRGFMYVRTLHVCVLHI